MRKKVSAPPDASASRNSTLPAADDSAVLGEGSGRRWKPPIGMDCGMAPRGELPFRVGVLRCAFLCTFRVFRFRRGSSGALAATAFRKMPSGMGKAKQADVQFIVPVDEVAPVYDTYTSILMSTASGDGYVAAPPKPIRASRQPALTV